jgi:hypothetical protein
MGLDSIKWCRALCLAALTAGLLSAPGSGREHKAGIWKVLRDGDFSGAMNEDAHVSPFGDMDVGGHHYRLMFFEWAESPRNMKGSFPHGQSRLLVFETRKKKLVYVGSYIYFDDDYQRSDARPHIEGNVVVFPYKLKEGDEPTNRLVFGEMGPPPRVVLDGEICDFFK